MKQIEGYECEICNGLYNKDIDASECEFLHKRKQYANCLLRNNYNLDVINHLCGFHWPLEAHRYLYKVTKNSKFIMHHLQCCDEPVYQIEEIMENGLIRVAGKPKNEEWYTTTLPILQLPEPYKEEE